MQYLKIRNWDKWQTYRKDRGQPPWIKVHRRLMRNPEWVSLSDADKGRLICIWMLAADNDGLIPNDPELIKKLCYLDKPPDLQTYIDLDFIGDNGVPDIEEEEDSGEGKIYFIEYEGSIKIGFSKNPWARLNALKTAMPNEPKLLAHFDGTKEIEQDLHCLFEGQRINREWYKPHPYLMEITTCGLPDVIPKSLPRKSRGLPVTPKAEAEAEKNRIYIVEAKKVLDYLNLKTGKAYQKTDEIQARLRDGGTVDQCKQIIDTKLKDPYFQENPKYYHPTTLFRKSNWDKYINQTPEDFKGKKHNGYEHILKRNNEDG